MFSDNLSRSILQLCERNKLSYEQASEQCQLSSRYFGNIVRGQSSPTVTTLEKLCAGFHLTPNELLLLPSLSDPEQIFQIPLFVSPCRYCLHYSMTTDAPHQQFCICRELFPPSIPCSEIRKAFL